MDTFRRVIGVLQPYISDTYDLLNAADAVAAIWPDHSTAPKAVFPHDALVACAKGSRVVMAAVMDSKKINAIKELRNLTGCGLKESKEAIEDSRVWAYYNVPECSE